MGGVRVVEVNIRDIASLRVRTNDVALFEVLGCGAYGVDLSLLGPVERVLDLGANVGLTAIYLSRRMPEARFCAVEPAPCSFALLEENLRRNAVPGIAVRAAAMAKPGNVAVVEGEHAGLTTVQRDPAGPIEGQTIPDLLDRAGFEQADLLKLDIQGGEEELLEHCEDWAPRVGAVIAEIHAPLTVDGALAALAPYGFRRLPLPSGRLFDDMLYARRD